MYYIDIILLELWIKGEKGELILFFLFQRTFFPFPFFFLFCLFFFFIPVTCHMFRINGKGFLWFISLLLLLLVPFKHWWKEIRIAEENGGERRGSNKTCDVVKNKKHEIKMQQTAGENNKIFNNVWCSLCLFVCVLVSVFFFIDSLRKLLLGFFF